MTTCKAFRKVLSIVFVVMPLQRKWNIKLHKLGVLVVFSKKSIRHPLLKSYQYTVVYYCPGGTTSCYWVHHWERSGIGSKLSHFRLWQTDGRTDLNELNNFSCREDRLSFKKNSIRDAQTPQPFVNIKKHHDIS